MNLAIYRNAATIDRIQLEVSVKSAVMECADKGSRGARFYNFVTIDERGRALTC